MLADTIDSIALQRIVDTVYNYSADALYADITSPATFGYTSTASQVRLNYAKAY